MRRISLLLFIAVIATTAVLAQQPVPYGRGAAASLMDGLGNLHHPVTTKNPAAQKYFDQGLRLIYAFNHDEA